MFCTSLQVLVIYVYTLEYNIHIYVYINIYMYLYLGMYMTLVPEGPKNPLTPTGLFFRGSVKLCAAAAIVHYSNEHPLDDWPRWRAAGGEARARRRPIAVTFVGSRPSVRGASRRTGLSPSRRSTCDSRVSDQYFF